VSHFAAVLARTGGSWRATEVSLAGCESIDEIADIARDVTGDLRLLFVEQDDEYAVVARVDGDDDIRVFLSDGHAADGYELAAVIADELTAILDQDDDGADDELESGPAGHESVPFGDPTVVEDLGTPAADLLELCAHEGTLPIDLILTVCERAGCTDAFEAVRA
jgi:putative tRNA adenosine deaminase-associated protein